MRFGRVAGWAVVAGIGLGVSGFAMGPLASSAQAVWSARERHGAFVVGLPVVSAQTTTRLDAVLRQMDAASAKFVSAQVDIRKEIFEKVVSNTEEQTGSGYFLRKGGTTQMGMKMNSGQIVEYKDSKLRLLTPPSQVNEFAAEGANKGRFETFLTLGFGGSGKDLEKAWTITDMGPEKMDGVETEKLDLVSKDAGARKNFTHVTVWIDPVRSVSLKQVFYFPNGDTQTAHYTNIRLNQKLDVGPFAIKCKGKCS